MSGSLRLASVAPSEIGAAGGSSFVESRGPIVEIGEGKGVAERVEGQGF